MTEDIYAIICGIIKAQNAELLAKIAAKYKMKLSYLENKYLRPTFYCVDINKDT